MGTDRSTSFDPNELTYTKTSMKYGTELQKRSVPQWRAHNIDYNDIKDLIKQATLPDAPSDILDRLVRALLQEYESVSATGPNSFDLIGPILLLLFLEEGPRA